MPFEYFLEIADTNHERLFQKNLIGFYVESVEFGNVGFDE